MKTEDAGQTGQAVIDHIVFGCGHLDSGTSYLEARLGSSFSAGGKHQLMATHNTLLRLQNSIYLEAIAVDHEALTTNGNIGRRRWFSLDEETTRQKIEISPKPLCWVVAVNDINEMISKCGYDAGEVTRVTRGCLEWWLTIPHDGSLSVSGLLPTFIEWPDGRNPSSQLPKNGTTLKTIILTHPHPDFIASIMDSIGVEGPIKVRHGPIELIFELQTPSGRLVTFSNATA